MEARYSGSSGSGIRTLGLRKPLRYGHGVWSEKPRI